MGEDGQGLSLAYVELGMEPGSPEHFSGLSATDWYPGLCGTHCWPADSSSLVCYIF